MPIDDFNRFGSNNAGGPKEKRPDTAGAFRPEPCFCKTNCITHRRGTMEASDVLYGVTMQEQGISKLLRLDLNQMEQQLGIVE